MAKIKHIVIPGIVDGELEVPDEVIASLVEAYLANHPETDPTVPSWAKQPTKPTYTASEVGALPDSTVIPVVPQMATAADMSDWTSGKTVDAAVLKADFTTAVIAVDNLEVKKADKTEIPTAVSELTNDSGYQTAAQVQTAIAAAAELPSGGSTGDFLRKTASGVAWETVQTYQGGSY